MNNLTSTTLYSSGRSKGLKKIELKPRPLFQFSGQAQRAGKAS